MRKGLVREIILFLVLVANVGPEQSLNGNSNSVPGMFGVCSNSVPIQILFRVWAYPVQSLRKGANFVLIQVKFCLETGQDISLCSNNVQYRYRPRVMNMPHSMFVRIIKLSSHFVQIQTLFILEDG